MRFWDSSAVVPLVVVEPTSPACRALIRSDPNVGAWYGTRVEVVSALRRQHREGVLDPAELALAERRADRATERWTILEATDELESEALRVVAQHPLRAGDAFQLGAAVLLAKRRPKGKQFVCRDGALARAAAREGFDVIVPKE